MSGDSLVNEAIKRILLDVVVRGHGDRLIGRWSREAQLEHFLEQVPYMLDRINQLHLACSRTEPQRDQQRNGCSHRHKTHHFHHHHNQQQQQQSQGQSSLYDFIHLIGDQRHWLVRTRDVLGLSPLHKAVLFNNRPIVKYILDRYPDELAAAVWRPQQSQSSSSGPVRLIDAQDKYGRTALHYAAALTDQSGQPDHLYQFLVAKGASQRIQDFRAKTAAYYLRHPNQLRSKSIIHLANKLNANYQANVLSKTLRASSSRAQIVCWEESDELRQVDQLLLESRQAPETNRESLSISCHDLSGSTPTGGWKRPERSKSSAGNDNDELTFEANPQQNQVISDQDSSRVDDKQELELTSDNSLSSTGTVRGSSKTEQNSRLNGKADAENALKQLLADRSESPAMDQKSKQTIRKSLSDGVVDKITELLIEGFGNYLVANANISCWNLHCKRYINNVIPSLLAKVDTLHELIAKNQKLAFKSLVNSEPILARIKRPYKKTALSALHLAVSLDRRSIVAYLTRRFPELVVQRDSSGATCLHWAAKAMKYEQLYCWLLEHFGPQLEHLRDLKGRSAADLRHQALRVSSQCDSLNTRKDPQLSARQILDQEQSQSNKLQLHGTKIELNKRTPKAKATNATSHSSQATSRLSVNLDSLVDQQESVSAASDVIATIVESNSSKDLPTQDESSMSDKLQLNMEELREQNEDDDKDADTRLSNYMNDMAQIDLNASQKAQEMDEDDDAANSEDSMMMAQFDLPISRPQSATMTSRLENLITECIQSDNFKKLEHIILAGCSARLVSVLDDMKSNPNERISREMQTFLDEKAPKMLETIDRIHETLHKCYAHSENLPQLNSTFHKLCNLLTSKRFIMSRDVHGASPLQVALIRSDRRVVDYLLRRHPEAASGPDYESRNALHYAAIVLSCYKHHGQMKIANRSEDATDVVGFWLVDETIQTIYDNLTARYEALIECRDKKGFTAVDYLKESSQTSNHIPIKGEGFQVSPEVIEGCCPEYARLLHRYNHFFLVDPSHNQDKPLSNSITLQEDQKPEIETADAQSNQQVEETIMEQVEPDPSNFDAINADILQETQECCVDPIDWQRKHQSGSHHRPKSDPLLESLEPNLKSPHRHQNHHHRHHHHHHHYHHAKKNITRQSVVGGVIVPTIIHNDKMDEIETYDIIYRQPAASTNQPSSASSFSSSSSDGSDVEQVVAAKLQSSPSTGRHSRLSKASDSRLLSRSERRKASSSDSSSGELDDDDEDRVERLSNEFENRVRREKDQLQLKVDQIMNEIKLSAKSGKSTKFFAQMASGSSNSSSSKTGQSSKTLLVTTTDGLPTDSRPQSGSSSGHSSGSSMSSRSSATLVGCNSTCSSRLSESPSFSSSSSTRSSSRSRRSAKEILPESIPTDVKASHCSLAKLASPSSIQQLAAQVVSKNTYGQTYLHFIASRSQSSSTLYKVLKHGSHLIGERDIFYRTARDVALQFNLANNVQVLDKFVIDLFIEGNSSLLQHLLNAGYSPLIHVSDSDGNDIMLILKLLKLDRMINFLLKMADFQRWRDELHTFIRHGYSAGVQELIKKHKDLVAAKSLHARTSLHLAVLFDRQQMIGQLIEADPSSVHLTDNMGRSALHYVYGLQSKNMESIRDKLLQSGASAEHRDVKMRTPKYYYIFKREIEDIKRIELEFN